ncbi:hypothetical protein QW180_30945 [Vibrio sinaloensis]|nr:hypothetical protein [Vibrio sinaloensis]
MITYSEAKVEWLNNKATLSVHAPLITGSTVKGIIAHRFFLSPSSFE